MENVINNLDKDIKILKEFIKNYKEVQEKYKDDEIQAEIERSCYFEEVPAQAIENVLKKIETQTNGINYLQRQLSVLNKEIKTKDKIINNAIHEIEVLREYFADDLQPDFIRILEILKNKKVIDW